MSELPQFKITDGDKEFLVSAPDEQSAMEEYNRQKSSGALDGLDVSQSLTPRNQQLKEARDGMPQLVPPMRNMLPWQDEIMAAAYATGAEVGDAVGINEPRPWSERYAEEKQNQQQMQDEARERWGVVDDVANAVGGAAALGPARGVGGQILPRAAKPLLEGNLVGRVAKSTGIGAGVGSAYGSGEGEGFDERIDNAVEGAKWGGSFGAGGQVAGELGSALVSRAAPLYRSIRNPQKQARATTTRALTDDVLDAPTRSPERGLTEDEFEWAKRQGYNVGNIDKGSENVTSLSDAIYQRSPRARNRINDFIADRDDQMLPMFESVIGSMRSTPDDIARRQANLRAGRDRVRPLYESAFAHPGAMDTWHEGYQQLLGSDVMQEAIRRANKIGTDEAALSGGNRFGSPFEFRKTSDGGERMFLRDESITPNLRYWDTVKKGLDETIEAERDAIKGLSPRGKRAQEFKHRLVTYLDEATIDPRTGKSSYQEARKAAQEYLGADSAAEAGRKMYRQSQSSATGLDEMGLKARRWSPDEREEAAQSFLAALQDDLVAKARSTDGNAGHVDLSLKFLKNEKSRRVARALLGEGRLNRLEMHNMIMRTMQHRNKSMTGNSRTWRRALGEEALSPLGGAAAGGILGEGDPTSMTYGTFLGLLARHGPKWVDNRMKTRIAPHIADELIGDDPHTYSTVINQLASDEQLQQYLKLMTHPLRLGAGQLGPQ